MKDRTGSVQNSHDMAPPFRSLVFLGIWKFLRGSSSPGLWAREGELLQLRASDCTLLRRSGASCSGITLSPHPGWSPFWLAVAEVAAEFFWGSAPSRCGSCVSVHSESAFPTALGFRAIFGHCARIKGNVALTITTPLYTHTLLLTQPPPLWKWRTRSSPPLQNAAVTVYIQENSHHLAADTGTTRSGDAKGRQCKAVVLFYSLMYPVCFCFVCSKQKVFLSGKKRVKHSI